MNFAFAADNRQNFQRCQADNCLNLNRVQFLLTAVLETLAYCWTFNGLFGNINDNCF